MFDFSVAIIVLMTGEKLYAVSRPMSAFRMNFGRKRLIIIITALVLCLVTNSHFIFTHSIIEMFEIEPNLTEASDINNAYSFKLCTFNSWDNFYDSYWPYIDATVYSFLPFTLLTTFNFSIFVCLKKEKRERLKLQELETIALTKYKINDTNTMGKVSKAIGRNGFITKSKIKNRRAAVVLENGKINFCRLKHNRQGLTYTNNRMTLTIFLINTSFCILTMPIVVLHIFYQIETSSKMENLIMTNFTIENIETLNTSSDNTSFNLMKAAFEILQYLNHSINFFIYCMCGQKFRAETKSFYLKVFKNKKFF